MGQFPNQPEEQSSIVGLGRSKAERDGAARGEIIEEYGLDLGGSLALLPAVRAEDVPKGFVEAEAGAVGDEDAQAVPFAAARWDVVTGALGEFIPEGKQRLEGENALGIDKRQIPTRCVPLPPYTGCLRHGTRCCVDLGERHWRPERARATRSRADRAASRASPSADTASRGGGRRRLRTDRMPLATV